VVRLEESSCEPTADFKNGTWTIRATIYGPNREVLPLFVTVKKAERAGFEATLESDQTDFSTERWNVRRKTISRLFFWRKP
jgi:hypothetical protein